MTSLIVEEDLIQNFHIPINNNKGKKIRSNNATPTRTLSTGIPYSATMPEFVMPNSIDHPQEACTPPIITVDNIRRNTCVINKPPKGRFTGPGRPMRTSLDEGHSLTTPKTNITVVGSCPNLTNDEATPKRQLSPSNSNDISGSISGRPRIEVDNDDPESHIGVPNMFVTSLTHSKTTKGHSEFSNSSPNLQAQARYQSRRTRSAGFQRAAMSSSFSFEHSLPLFYRDRTVSQILNFLYLGTVETAYSEHLLCKIQVERLIDLSNKMPDEIPASLKSITSCACPPTTIHSRAKLCISVDDREEEGIDVYFKEINVFIEGARKNGKGVLIFSYEGTSRAPTVVLQYLMTYHDMDLRTAYNWVRRLRPEVDINPGFQRILERTERRCGYDQSLLFDELNNVKTVNRKVAWTDC